MHADTVDLVLMILGFIGAVGDGLTLPLTLVVTSKLMNNIGGVSNLNDHNAFTSHINQVLSSSSFFLYFPFFFYSFSIHGVKCVHNAVITIILWVFILMDWNACGAYTYL